MVAGVDPSRLFERAELVALGMDRPDRDPRSKLCRRRRGVYGDDPGDDPLVRYLQQIHASSRTLTGDTVYSHESAVALLGLPLLGPWPEHVHLIGERRSGGRSQLDVRRHCLGLEDVPLVIVHGLAVTSPARTAFDFALSRSFESAVVVIDAVLRDHPGSAEELAALLDRYGSRRGHHRARVAIEFGAPASGSAGESWSRALMELHGFERPELQLVVETNGREEQADFGWRRHRALGEFDGEIKYRIDRYRKGGTVEDVVIREKNRENRLRLQFPNVGRWDWSDLRGGRLPGLLDGIGIPRRRTRTPRGAPGSAR